LRWASNETRANADGTSSREKQSSDRYISQRPQEGAMLRVPIRWLASWLVWRHLFHNHPGGHQLSLAQVILRLQVHPEIRRRIEEARQPHGGICSTAAPLKHNIVNAGRRDTQRARQGVGTHPQRLQVLLAKHFARVD